MDTTTNHIRDAIILFLLSNFLIFVSSAFLAYGNMAPKPLSMTIVWFGYESLTLAVVATFLSFISLNEGIKARGKKDA